MVQIYDSVNMNAPNPVLYNEQMTEKKWYEMKISKNPYFLICIHFFFIMDIYVILYTYVFCFFPTLYTTKLIFPFIFFLTNQLTKLSHFLFFLFFSFFSLSLLNQTNNLKITLNSIQ